jgi:hypothetical protein
MADQNPAAFAGDGKDADLIDPRRDLVWAVDVRLAYPTYVIGETAERATEIAADAVDEDRWLDTDDEYVARPLTGPLPDDGDVVPWGHSLWGDRQLTVNEVLELIERHRPVYDTQTLLMPFVDALPPMPVESDVERDGRDQDLTSIPAMPGGVRPRPAPLGGLDGCAS